jgi:hypothetical protein
LKEGCSIMMMALHQHLPVHLLMMYLWRQQRYGSSSKPLSAKARKYQDLLCVKKTKK